MGRTKASFGCLFPNSEKIICLRTQAEKNYRERGLFFSFFFGENEELFSSLSAPLAEPFAMDGVGNLATIYEAFLGHSNHSACV